MLKKPPKTPEKGNIGVPSQSPGNSTLFLYKHCLLFLKTNMANGHVNDGKRSVAIYSRDLSFPLIFIYNERKILHLGFVTSLNSRYLCMLSYLVKHDFIQFKPA